MEASTDPIRANPDETPYEGILVVLNEKQVSCKKCGHVHKFITSDCRPIGVRSDDSKAISMYGAMGELVPVNQEGLVIDLNNIEIRDHRFDDDEIVESPTDIGLFDPEESDASAQN